MLLEYLPIAVLLILALLLAGIVIALGHMFVRYP